MADNDDVMAWLLAADPVLRWQVERDLLGAPEAVWTQTRARTATEGFGARLIALQDADGRWAGGAWFPHDASRDEEGQPWTATGPTLATLRTWGVPASALAGTAERIDASARWEYDDLPYWGGEVDVCINAETLAAGTWLGADVGELADWFVEHRLPDGGWNCEWVEGSTKSSFHSTLNALIGILDYEKRTGGSSALRAARKGGEEYLLERRLLYSLSTGESVGPWATEFAYPFRWSYSALRALDYFRDAASYDDVSPDPRLADAIAVVRAAEGADGRWTKDAHHIGRVWFDEDVAIGEPSPWLTFYAMRVLRWWDAEA